MLNHVNCAVNTEMDIFFLFCVHMSVSITSVVLKKKNQCVTDIIYGCI